MQHDQCALHESVNSRRQTLATLYNCFLKKAIQPFFKYVCWCCSFIRQRIPYVYNSIIEEVISLITIFNKFYLKVITMSSPMRKHRRLKLPIYLIHFIFYFKFLNKIFPKYRIKITSREASCEVPCQKLFQNRRK